LLWCKNERALANVPRVPAHYFVCLGIRTFHERARARQVRGYKNKNMRLVVLRKYARCDDYTDNAGVVVDARARVGERAAQSKRGIFHGFNIFSVMSARAQVYTMKLNKRIS
jgi:hypothetical protein